MIEENLIKKLVTASKCEICGHRLEAGNIDILGHEKDLWFLQITCTKCQSRSLVAAVVKDKKGAEIITDLSKSEIARFKKKAPVTADDMLDMHNYLKKFNGNFARIFRKKIV